MTPLERFQELQDTVQEIQRRHAMSEGALEQHLAELRTNFQCDSLEASHKLLNRLSKETDQAEAGFNQLMDQIQDKWGDKLQDI